MVPCDQKAILKMFFDGAIGDFSSSSHSRKEKSKPRVKNAFEIHSQAAKKQLVSMQDQ